MPTAAIVERFHPVHDGGGELDPGGPLGAVEELAERDRRTLDQRDRGSAQGVLVGQLRCSPIMTPSAVLDLIRFGHDCTVAIDPSGAPQRERH